jgi:hypothetical protein
MPTLADRQVIDSETTRRITRHLVDGYAHRYPVPYIEDVVIAAHESLSHARVRVFVPIFIERLARETLEQSTRDGGEGQRKRRPVGADPGGSV